MVKSDEEYESIFQSRLSRLTAMKGGSDDLNSAVEEALSLTRSAHTLAGAMVLNGSMLRDAATPEQRLKAAIWAYRKNRAIVASKLAPVSLQDTESAQKKAYSFVEVLIQSGNTIPGDHYVTDVLKSAFPDETPAEYRRIESVVELLLIDYSHRAQMLQVKIPMITMSELYRALLYSGAMKVIGSELERADLARKVRDLAFDLAAEVFKGITILKSLAELINTGDPTHKLSSVEAAHQVQEYLDRYRDVLIEWMMLALPVNEVLTIDT
jgi:hypothetical protein